MTKREHLAKARGYEIVEASPVIGKYKGMWPVFLHGEWHWAHNKTLALWHYLLAYAPDGVREEV